MIVLKNNTLAGFERNVVFIQFNHFALSSALPAIQYQRLRDFLSLFKCKKRAEIPSFLPHRPVGKQLIRVALCADICDGNIL